MNSTGKRGTVQLLLPIGEVPRHGAKPTLYEALVAKVEQKFILNYASVKEHYGFASAPPYGIRGNAVVNLRAVMRINAAWHPAKPATTGAQVTVPPCNGLVAGLVNFMGIPPSKETWGAGSLLLPHKTVTSVPSVNTSDASAPSRPPSSPAPPILSGTSSASSQGNSAAPASSDAGSAAASAGGPLVGQQAASATAKATRAACHGTVSGRDKCHHQRMASYARKEAKRVEQSRAHATALLVTPKDQDDAASATEDAGAAVTSACDSSSQQPSHDATSNTSMAAAETAASLQPAPAAPLVAPNTNAVMGALHAKLAASQDREHAAAARADSERRERLQAAAARHKAEQDAAAAQRSATCAAREAERVVARGARQVRGLEGAVASSRAEAAAAREALHLQLRLDRSCLAAASVSGGKCVKSKGPCGGWSKSTTVIRAAASGAASPAVGTRVTGCKAAMQLLASARRRARREVRHAARWTAAAATAAATAAAAAAAAAGGKGQQGESRDEGQQQPAATTAAGASEAISLLRHNDSANEREGDEESGQDGGARQHEAAPAGPAQDLLAPRAPASEGPGGQSASAAWGSSHPITVDAWEGEEAVAAAPAPAAVRQLAEEFAESAPECVALPPPRRRALLKRGLGLMGALGRVVVAGGSHLMRV